MVRAEILDPIAAEKAIRQLNQECKEISIDARNRWNIPVELVDQTGLFGRSNSVVLTANRF